MGIWNSLFNSSDTLGKATDAVINTGDKLFYTDEEKAEDRQKQREFFPILLKAYEPFKIAQRILAVWFSILYGLAFIVGVVITVFNMIATYKANVNSTEAFLVPIEPLYALVSAFSLGIIMLAIVSFYFAGGTLESFKNMRAK